MIEELNILNTNYVNELENLFPNIFNIGDITNENNPYSKYLIYTIDNHVIGFINYYLVYERLEIANFNVLDEYQNKGYGDKLLKYLIKKYQNNKTNITLEVRKDNDKAIYLYEKNGFKNVAIRKNYYNGVDGILMD